MGQHKLHWGKFFSLLNSLVFFNVYIFLSCAIFFHFFYSLSISWKFHHSNIGGRFCRHSLDSLSFDVATEKFLFCEIFAFFPFARFMSTSQQVVAAFSLFCNFHETKNSTCWRLWDSPKERRYNGGVEKRVFNGLNTFCSLESC
jgi:hypothetical protein